MIDIRQFRDLIIDPTLEDLGMYSIAASELLLGTAIQESRLTYLTQLDGDANPYDDAMGLFQTERKTIEDLWANWLKYRTKIKLKVLSVCEFVEVPEPQAVIWNLRYAVCMARLHYRRVPQPLPAVGDLAGQAQYWVQWYNTAGGKGSAKEYVTNWRGAHGKS